MQNVLRTCLWLTVGLAACRSAAPATNIPATPATRFPNAAEIEIMMEGDSLPRPARFRGPRYPFKLLGARAVDELVAAFVVDTAGRVEKPSISFVQPPKRREFQESVCKFLQDEATFIPGQTNGRARRTLVFMPFAFTLNFDAPSGPAPDVKGMQEHARAAPRDQLVAELESRPHC